MGDRKRGDDLEYFPECRGKARHSLPAPAFQEQYRREQQGKQEKDVVEPDPDVPDAFAAVVEELRESRNFRELERLRGVFGTENSRACPDPVLQAQQTLVLRFKY